ncbi:TetR family transcriptional regulator [Planobispora rosea]|uniref:TetR family transcriptional regulator n=1 Tax=Planobispora rosea TaxID=35762 RepID=A0A8J3S3V2_PLARO|nr:TetR/AcrR family transcriptional regulator [Planobispora rosea]GGS98081.1 TetR family transcriptional regulator [Planobispora rosea]GIH87926.1 TetR family transcriptional regulator [Planobispora rosea]
MTSLRADAARNRALLLATARQAVASGDLSLQLNELARRAGVGVGTVYRHFPTRRVLLESLAEPAFAAVLDGAQTASLHDDPRTGVEILLRALLLQQLADPAFAAVIASPSTDDATPQTTAQRNEFNTLARTVLARARQSGALRPGLTDEDLHHLVCGTAFALGLGPTPAARVDAYLRVLLDGVAGKAE